MDILIVGSGIAGLRVATELLKTNKFRIQIVEQYSKTGGRMETIRVGSSIQYESGAGRIHSSHKELLDLIKIHKLTVTGKTYDIMWRSSIEKKTEHDDFFTLFTEYCRILKNLPREKLQTQTIRDLLIELLGVELAKNILDTYPYRAELEIMNADSSLDLFQSLKGGKFYFINEGFSKLIELMTENLKEKGVEFKFSHEIQRLEFNPMKKIYTVSGISKGKHVEFQAPRVILAVQQKALEKIYPFSPDHPLVKKVRMEPLLRIYSTYNNSDWFPETSVVTDSPLRYIIPINKAQGLIMSSYLDARDIEPWLEFVKKENNEMLKDKIQNETQNLFPELVIPKSKYTKAHLWRNGCSYWLPGNYDYREASREALYPMPETYPNLHIVGESFSLKQQWIEGAIEHADSLVKLINES